VIITDSLSTLIAIEGDIKSKNPKTLSLRKLLDEEREKITLLWVPGRMGIPGNEIADEEAKATLKYDLLATEKYPSQDLINWIKTEDKKTRKARCQNSENNMKNRKKRSNGIKIRKDEKPRPGRNLQVTNGYTMSPHGFIINKQDNNEYPSCNVGLTVDHIL
jgi:hypothetical protein